MTKPHRIYEDFIEDCLCKQCGKENQCWGNLCADCRKNKLRMNNYEL